MILLLLAFSSVLRHSQSTEGTDLNKQQRAGTVYRFTTQSNCEAVVRVARVCDTIDLASLEVSWRVFLTGMDPAMMEVQVSVCGPERACSHRTRDVLKNPASSTSRDPQTNDDPKMSSGQINVRCGHFC